MLNENVKVDVALYPQAVSANGSTGQYFSMDNYTTALFKFTVGSPGVTAANTSTAISCRDVGRAVI